LVLTLRTYRYGTLPKRPLSDRLHTERDQRDAVAGSGYFNLGTIAFTTGANAGISRTVKTYLQGASGTVSLIAPFPLQAQAGDAFTLTPGRDKQQTTCQSKFNNLVNFRGFPTCPKAPRQCN